MPAGPGAVSNPSIPIFSLHLPAMQQSLRITHRPSQPPAGLQPSLIFGHEEPAMIIMRLGTTFTVVKRPKRFLFYLVGFFLMLSGNVGKDV